MPRPVPPGHRGFTSVALLLCVAGCGDSTSVSGTLHYDGQPVDNGTITFLPADGVGIPASGSITRGSYAVDKLAPGPKVVQVIAVKILPFPQSSEEMARLADQNKARGDGPGRAESADIIPEDAEGNNATVEIKPGKQTLNLDLKKPARAKGR